MKPYIVIVLAVFFLACEKGITIQPENQPAKLVVEAQIENGQPPIVQLSNSLNFFSLITRAMLQGSFVHDAAVTVSNGTLSQPLIEYKVPIDSGYFVYYYGLPAGAPLLLGEEGKTYKLDIRVGGAVYTSSTTIPVLAKTIDSLWWKPAPRVEDTPRVTLMVKVTDPPGYGNYIRYFTRVNRDPFFPGASSVFDDQIVDGTTYEIQVDRGINRNDTLDEKEYGFFRRGDTATVKFANIDKVSFEFWRGLEYSYQSVGNPFSTPTRVVGNISNGALGAFCGYAVQYKTVIIPK
ncbi:DUF4249 domain-containing protein [Segetibacter sp. 3557_3]|uniref:DUF4249 domain-containing protein n=1 Tax=Segetibacter sp. 3557_3 TaxID=2547429 RepID=UPI00105840B4|nr:DUF4249 domain-containing protein [Segetibacter sp. 3557_3]TDH29183.1 DUF4249 domain-containing protein [Segetibacter sp. 3557_3]